MNIFVLGSAGAAVVGITTTAQAGVTTTTFLILLRHELQTKEEMAAATPLSVMVL